jgi:hypothetical protein
MADEVSAEALTALQSAVAALLPAAVPAGISRSVRVMPRRVRPLGLGGYIGLHREPDASLYGRRVDARVDVDVAGGSDDVASGYAATLSGQILAQTPTEFAQRGFHRVRGVDVDSRRALAFDVDFEYVRTPVAGEGVINELALDTFNNMTPYRTRSVAAFAGSALAFEAVPLADFSPFTDAAAAPPAAWAFDAAAPAALVQTAATASGTLTLDDAEKGGAQLLWRPRGAALDLPRFVVSVTFRSGGPDGVGVVFHRRAADDFSFFLASQSNNYHLFGRRTPGGWSVIASTTAGFTPGAVQRLVVGAYDGQLFAELGERRTLSASTTPALGGEIALLTHGNATARFLAGRLMELI